MDEIPTYLELLKFSKLSEENKKLADDYFYNQVSQFPQSYFDGCEKHVISLMRLICKIGDKKIYN